ncbi:MAG: 1-acyl-sn-glycerol-3-phosphate acyltransferase [Verrucomicrobia bacterium]|nr:1-acyl-sn-glycerol-3-phosphate acyltransferase [Verrucomicrobiota bacterium]
MSGILKHPLRFVGRFAQFLWLLVGAGGSFFFCYWLTGRAKTFRGRCEWLQRWSRFAVRIFGTTVELRGVPPPAGLIVGNHLGYHDVLVLATLQPTVFVARADVAGWPVFGWFVKSSGALFLDRDRRGDVARFSEQFQAPLAEQLAVVMFLEGTSTGGDRVLPFRPSLLEPATVNDWPVTPVWIGYSMREGSVADEVAYWRDMTILPHMMNLLTKTDITAHVAFGEPIKAGDRKELARRLHARTCELAGLFGRKISSEAPAESSSTPTD